MRGLNAFRAGVAMMGIMGGCTDDTDVNTVEAAGLRSIVGRVDALPSDVSSDEICRLGYEISDAAMALIAGEVDTTASNQAECIDANNDVADGYIQCAVEGPDYKTQCTYKSIENHLFCGLYLTQDVIEDLSTDSVTARPGAGAVFYNADGNRMVTVAGSYKAYTAVCDPSGVDNKRSDISKFISEKLAGEKTVR